jgi:hypothetical protein
MCKYKGIDFYKNNLKINAMYLNLVIVFGMVCLKLIVKGAKT